jgi:hypothetical protein
MDLPVDLGDGETVLVGVVEDQERFLVSQNLPDMLETKGRVLQFDSFENDQIPVAVRNALPVFWFDQVIMVGDGHEVVTQVQVGLAHLLRVWAPSEKLVWTCRLPFK